MWRDLRFAFRVIAKNPLLTAAAIVSLALGIGANTTIFTFADALLLRRPPVAAPQQMAELIMRDVAPNVPLNGYLPYSYPDYQDIAANNKAFSGVLVYDPVVEVNWTQRGEIQPLVGQLVSANYFSVLGVNPIIGRGFLRDEGKGPGRSPVAVISFRFWREHFAGDAGIVGRSLTLNGRAYDVVGVAPRGFTGIFGGLEPAFWAPVVFCDALGAPGLLTHRGDRNLFAAGRLRPGVTFAQATANLAVVQHRLDKEYPNQDDAEFGGLALPLRMVPKAFRGAVSGMTELLWIVVGLILLIAGANAANLLLVQAAGRQREMALRAALGAGRGRLIRQALTESVVLALIAGGIGVLLAAWAAPLVVGLQPPGFPIALSPASSGALLAFALGLAVVTGLAFGLVPALRGSKINLVARLKEGTAGAGLVRSRLRSGLVAAQVAVCTVVLVGAGLCLRSLGNAQSINPGFDAHHLLVAQGVDPQSLGLSGAAAANFMQRVVETARRMPGVLAASMIDSVPLQLSESDTGVIVPGVQRPPGQNSLGVDYTNVGADYFHAMGTRLLRGRGFTREDAAQHRRLVVVNAAFAARYFGHQNPVGKQITVLTGGNHLPSEIIGVAETGKYRSLDEAPRAFLFVLSDFDHPATLMLRTAGDPQSMVGPLRRVLTQLDPNLPADLIETGAQYMAVPLAPARITGILLAAFGLLALALAIVGLYGVVAYSASQRTREFGIRVALGAQSGAVAGLVVRQGLRIALLGVAIGVAIALAAARLLQSLLYGVGAADPLTFVAVAALLVAVAALASFIPAWRATRTDPLLALRYE